MKILLWVFLLCILLFFSLGNKIPLIWMPSHIVSKYKSPPDYYSDTMAIQGVFYKTIEPMSNAPKMDGSKLSNKTTLSTNRGRSADLTQLKTNQPMSKIQGRNPQPVQLRSVQSTSATTASTYPGTRDWNVPGSSCTSSQYGCCDDGVTAKNADGTSCPVPASASCTSSQYGCCDDGVTAKNANGSNCAEYSPNKPSVYVLPKPPTYPQNTHLTQPHDPYTHSEETVYLSPPMGKPAVPTCPSPQPCPPCGRCPEPSFECKKVPNYSSTSNVLPVPVLTDFSQFGM